LLGVRAIRKKGRGFVLKALSVDFWSDTLSNLEALSNSTRIPKNEIIRRGAEVYLLLYNVSEKDATKWLLDSLHGVERILTSKHSLDIQELRSELSKSTVFAAALISVYITHVGRDQPHVLKLYFRAIEQHLLVISEPKVKLDQSDIESIKEDVISFANIVSKLSEQDLSLPQIQSRMPKNLGSTRSFLEDSGRYSTSNKRYHENLETKSGKKYL
jgi:hypothetical protein